MRRVLGWVSTVALGTSLAVGIGATPAAAAGVSKSVSPNSAPITVAQKLAGDALRVKFQGIAGQVVSVGTTNGTWGTNCDATLRLVRPGSVTMAGPICAGQSGAINSVTLPSSGTYEADLVEAVSQAALRSARFTLTSTLAVQSITAAAAPVTITVAAGGTVDLGFSGSTGKFVSARATGGNLDCAVRFSIVKPDGTAQTLPTCANSTPSFIDASTLGASGVYKLRATSTAAASRSIALQLWQASHIVGSITPNGAAVTPKTIPGQNAYYSFSASVGQHLTVSISANTLAYGYVRILHPDGTEFAQCGFGPGATQFCDFDNLDVAGTWNLEIDPNLDTTGSVSATLRTVTDITGTLTLGTPKAVTTTQPGQNARYTFTGTSGQAITISVTSNTIASGFVDLIRPNGTSGPYCAFSAATAFCDSITLDASGTWSAVVDPSGSAIGSLTFTIAAVSSGGGGTMTYGVEKTITVSTPGTTSTCTFAGVSGQRVTITYRNSTISGGYITLYRPGSMSSYVGYKYISTGSGFNDPLVLDATGNWTLEVDPNGTATGSVAVRLDTVTDTTGTITVGADATATVTQAGQRVLYTFHGTTGQHLSLSYKNSTITSGYVSLYDPSGSSTSFYISMHSGADFLDPFTLTATGTWTVEVDPYDIDTGHITVRLDTVTDIAGTITVGGASKAVSITQPGQVARFTFSGTKNDVRTVTISGSTFPTGGYVSLFDSHGTEMAYTTITPGTFKILAHTLESSGTWTIVIDPYSTNTGSGTLSLT